MKTDLSFLFLSRSYIVVRNSLESGFPPCYSVYYSIIYVLSQSAWSCSYLFLGQISDVHLSLVLSQFHYCSSLSLCSWVPSKSQHPGIFFSGLNPTSEHFIFHEYWNPPLFLTVWFLKPAKNWGENLNMFLFCSPVSLWALCFNSCLSCSAYYCLIAREFHPITTVHAFPFARNSDAPLN